MMKRLFFFLLFMGTLAACTGAQPATANPALRSADPDFFLTSDDVVQQAQQTIQNAQLTGLLINYDEHGNHMFWYTFTGDDQDFTANYFLRRKRLDAGPEPKGPDKPALNYQLLSVGPTVLMATIKQRFGESCRSYDAFLTEDNIWSMVVSCHENHFMSIDAISGEIKIAD